jgi:hypothetical protein
VNNLEFTKYKLIRNLSRIESQVFFAQLPVTARQ